MQYIEIHIKGKEVARLPLGGYDLMMINSGNRGQDALERSRLIEMLLSHFWKEPLISKSEFKQPVYYLVFESRMNNVKGEMANVKSELVDEYAVSLEDDCRYKIPKEELM